MERIPSSRLWLVLFLCVSALQLSQTAAQAVSPSIPPTVVKEAAPQKLLQDTVTPCDRACASLASQLPSQLFLGQTGDFSIWDGKQSDVIPACRVEPASDEDVSLILKTVTTEGCHFAVKSGGHARSAGFSNADAGVTIDLMRMSRVELSTDKKSVRVGAGARWVDVYSALEKDNLTVVGGRVADVGVGGLTLGGGISFFTARHGLACDSVLSYSIVLPDSSLATVTAQSHPDLYFALRGAGQVNFGIVTSFVYETIPLPNPAGLWDGNKMYSFDQVPAVIDAWHTVHTESLATDPNVGGFNVYAYVQPYESWFVIDRYIHTSHASDTTWPPSWAPFEQIEGVPNTTRVAVRPYSDISIELSAASPYGTRNIYATFSHKPSAALTARLVEIHREEVMAADSGIASLEGVLPCFVNQPLSTAAISHTAKNGGNALGLTPSDGPLIIVSLSWTWKHASDDATAYAAYHRFIARAESAAKSMGLWHPFKYANYAEASQERDVWVGYGAENVERLRRVQRAMDPEGVFVRGGLAGGGFKLNSKTEENGGVREEGGGGAVGGRGGRVVGRKSEL